MRLTPQLTRIASRVGRTFVADAQEQALDAAMAKIRSYASSKEAVAKYQPGQYLDNKPVPSPEAISLGVALGVFRRLSPTQVFVSLDSVWRHSKEPPSIDPPHDALVSDILRLLRSASSEKAEVVQASSYLVLRVAAMFPSYRSGVVKADKVMDPYVQAMWGKTSLTREDIMAGLTPVSTRAARALVKSLGDSPEALKGFFAYAFDDMNLRDLVEALGPGKYMGDDVFQTKMVSLNRLMDRVGQGMAPADWIRTAILVFDKVEVGVSNALIQVAAISYDDFFAPDQGAVGRFAGRRAAASLGDISHLFGYRRASDDTLIHKATKDLWAVQKQGDEYLIERLFDSTGSPIKV